MKDVEPDDDRFGVLLRRLRGAAGLTQEALAEAAGVGVRTVRDLELGAAVRPQRCTAERLATALQAAPADREAMLERAHGPSRRRRRPVQSVRTA